MINKCHFKNVGINYFGNKLFHNKDHILQEQKSLLKKFSINPQKIKVSYPNSASGAS